MNKREEWNTLARFILAVQKKEPLDEIVLISGIKIWARSIESLADWESIKHLVDDIQQGRKPNNEALSSCIQSVIQYMDTLKSRQGRKKKRFTIDTPGFGVAMRLVRKEIGDQEAIDLLCNLTGLQERQARDYLTEMKPRARTTSKSLQKLDELGARNKN